MCLNKLVLSHNQDKMNWLKLNCRKCLILVYKEVYAFCAHGNAVISNLFLS